MSALKPNAVSKFVGDLLFRTAGTNDTFVDIGAVRGLIFGLDSSANRVEINSDNKGTILSGYTPETTIEVELLENADRDLIYKLFGGTSSDVAGVLTTVTDAMLRATGSWADGEVIYVDGVNSTFAITNLKNNGTTVTAGNYQLVKDPTANRYGVINKSGSAITITGTGLTITYGYTPAASKELTITNGFTSDVVLEVKIQAVSNGKYRTITLDKSVVEGKHTISFSDPTNGGDLKGAQLTIKLQKGGTFKYHDEI